MDQDQIRISCRKCKQTFTFTKGGIINHVNRSECRNSYTQQQLTDLSEHSQKIRSAKHKIKMAERYQRNKAQIADKYENNREEIAKKYDKSKRAAKYQEKRKEISKKYKVDKQKRESDEGKQFFRIFEMVCQDIYSELRTMYYQAAFDKINNNMGDLNINTLDHVFQSESWVAEVQSMTRDCQIENNRLKEARPEPDRPYTPVPCSKLAFTKDRKRRGPCIWHMTTSKLDKFIETAIYKAFEKKADEMIDEKAEKLAEWEYMLSVENYDAIIL